ncbi:hotdog family protein [Vibrio mangrovi]|nr:hotdog family protein [Vibrio mangrovi]MDW6001858.1 hotdog family protein [Vibrio mangrovi]
MSNIPAIEQLIPHDSPMIFIDHAIDIQDESVHCQVTIGENNPFFDTISGTLPAYVGLEFMAQTIAAWSGFRALQSGEKPSIGFLLGSRRYQASCDTFAQGQLLDIYAQKVMEDHAMGMAVFSAQIENRGEQLAQCQLNVYLPSTATLQQMKLRSQR